MKRKQVNLRLLLAEILFIEKISFYSQEGRTRDDIRLTLYGFKRLIYGLWHNGENELGQNMVNYLSHHAQFEYYELMRKYYCDYEMPKINF